MRCPKRQLTVFRFQFSVILSVLLLLAAGRRLPTAAYAVTNPQSSDEIVNSTTIPDSTVSIPHLRSPSNGFYTTNSTSLLFSWQRSTCDTGIDHYTVYRDDIIVADGITHADTQTTSVYTASVDSSYVYLTFKAALSEGSHTWKVIAVGSEGNTASSETWTFTVDTTIPDIILKSVDKNTMYWATHDPTTIPPWDQRQLIVTTSDPLISGKVEANSNIKFSLSSGQTVTVFEADGNWEHRFRNLTKNVTYSVFITATDTAGNSNSFPEFTITHLQGQALKVTPTQAPTIPTQPSIFPTSPPSEGGERVGVPEPPPTIPEFRLPPPPPTLTPTACPPNCEAVGRVIPGLTRNLSPLILFGLLLHLTLTFYGAGIRLGHLPGFLYTLCFPFLGKKAYEIDPFFATVAIFDPANLSHEFFSWVSNIKGKISLEFPKSQPQIFLQLTRPGYEKQSLLLATAAIPEGTVIKLKPKDHPSRLERLKTFALNIRGLPLIIADVTSLVVLILAPSLPVAFYFGLAATLTFSEYIYPRIKISNS